MKTQKILLSLFIFTTLLSCSSNENSTENNLTNSYIKTASLDDDGNSGEPKEFIYNADNKISKIIYGSFSILDITYSNDIVSLIKTTNNNSGYVAEFHVTIENNTISLTSTDQIIELDFTNEYIDAFRIIYQNPTQLIWESTFTRNSDSNINSFETSTSTSNTVYNYSNFDNKKCTTTYNSYNNDYALIFGLKPSVNNPLTAEYIYNNGNPSMIDYTLQYDDADNVIQLNQTVIQINYEYIEL